MRSSWIWKCIGALILLTVFGIVCNPVGEIRLRQTERHLASELERLPKGSDVAAIRAFCDREHLDSTEPMGDPFTYNPPLPKGTKFEIYAKDGYEAQFFGMSARVVVFFWLDGDKRLIKAELSRSGGAL